MCNQLTDLRRATSKYAARFDANLLDCGSAARVVKEAAAIEAMACTLKSLAAARVAETDSWRRNGHRSAPEELAKDTGTSVSVAREVIETGRRLSRAPKLAAAARRGELSFAQTSMIANAAEADPTSEKSLVEDASRLSLSELKDRCARTKAAAHRDLEARRREIHSRRYLRSWTDMDGMSHLAAGANPEHMAKVMAALSPITEEIFRTARTEGRKEHPCAYALDALVQMSEESAGSSSRHSREGAPGTTTCNRTPVKLLVRIDYDTWMRGAPIEDETCELVGYGPVATSAVRDLVGTGDPFVAAILTKGRALVGVAHLGRKPTTYQESALQWLYPSCAVEGCGAQARLERDHRVEWSKTHYTAFELLDLLCSHHHALKTREGWELVDGTGKRRFVSPNDPDHPRRHKRSRAPSAGPP